ncbi:MFS transporter [Curtobacterium sp. MCJR17_043]|uniref:MFS transporter n=1 Tax=Curtobacterium sp. MCJR17_043 TaxID=2175660 RepID=UPI0024E03047|nr:MFS transporter [Curtobacterium sp. MCJR17_043]WIB35420.1 MFS transporter [Curtobacterium sp. MCJR17_043]
MGRRHNSTVVVARWGRGTPRVTDHAAVRLASGAMTTTTRRTSSTAVAVLVAGTFFMELLDGTILATAAPAMGRDLGVDSAAVGVAITAYLVTLAVFIPVSGWITDRVGSRTVFVGAIALFTLASALCAASTGLVELTLWRILQGLGGALMVPVGRLVVLRSAGRDQLVTAIAILTWPALAAPIIAPFLGGVLVDTLSWHWIFLVNIPLGVVAVVAALVLVPQERAPERVPFDWRGSVLACLGLGALVVMASLLALETVPVVPAVVAGVVGAGCTWLAIRHFRRAPHPIMGLDAFRLETFRVSHAGGSLFRLAVSAVPFVLPLLFQDAWGVDRTRGRVRRPLGLRRQPRHQARDHAVPALVGGTVRSSSCPPPSRRCPSWRWCSSHRRRRSGCSRSSSSSAVPHGRWASPRTTRSRSRTWSSRT